MTSALSGGGGHQKANTEIKHSRGLHRFADKGVQKKGNCEDVIYGLTLMSGAISALSLLLLLR